MMKRFWLEIVEVGMKSSVMSSIKIPALNKSTVKSYIFLLDVV